MGLVHSANGTKDMVLNWKPIDNKNKYTRSLTFFQVVRVYSMRKRVNRWISLKTDMFLNTPVFSTTDVRV